jgi:DNA mismatch repair ATPase MutS
VNEVNANNNNRYNLPDLTEEQLREKYGRKSSGNKKTSIDSNKNLVVRSALVEEFKRECDEIKNDCDEIMNNQRERMRQQEQEEIDEGWEEIYTELKEEVKQRKGSFFSVTRLANDLVDFAYDWNRNSTKKLTEVVLWYWIGRITMPIVYIFAAIASVSTTLFWDWFDTFTHTYQNEIVKAVLVILIIYIIGMIYVFYPKKQKIENSINQE